MSISAIFSSLFTLDTLLCLVLGVVGGVMIGAMPGLSAAMGVTLLIPVTFGMDPVPALVMLTAVYTSAVYGGSITAVLIHTPGTPSSACTAIDGFELTKQGKGMLGVGISTIASMVGGTLSGIALLTISPLLAKFAMKCSALEYFFLAFFGICIMGGLADDEPEKGLISGVFGLLIGMVGLDPIYGVARFTFGSLNMQCGIRIAPALIGLFAVSQVLIFVEQLAAGKVAIYDDPDTAMKGSVFPTRQEMRRLTPVMIKSGLIGILTGIIPAAGGNIGSWMAYKACRSTSKYPEEYGHGSIEGVAASESANNGVTGGALIPLLTLGIPGSSVAAILLGGLMIHGLQPGADLFTKHGDITYPIIVGFIFANILMGIFGLSLTKPIARVCVVPMAILAPIILGLAALGAYATNNSFYDVIIMAVFGMIGYVMQKFGFATAPMTLGLCLSSMVEANWMRATVLARGDMWAYFLKRPIALVLAVLVVFTLLGPVISKLVKKVKTKKEKI